MHVILSKRSRGKKFGDCVTASFFTPFIMMHDIVLTEDWAIHYTPRHDIVTCNTCNTERVTHNITHHQPITITPRRHAESCETCHGRGRGIWPRPGGMNMNLTDIRAIREFRCYSGAVTLDKFLMIFIFDMIYSKL